MNHNLQLSTIVGNSFYYFLERIQPTHLKRIYFDLSLYTNPSCTGYKLKETLFGSFSVITKWPTTTVKDGNCQNVSLGTRNKWPESRQSRALSKLSSINAWQRSFFYDEVFVKELVLQRVQTVKTTRLVKVL